MITVKDIEEQVSDINNEKRLKKVWVFATKLNLIESGEKLVEQAKQGDEKAIKRIINLYESDLADREAKLLKGEK